MVSRYRSPASEEVARESIACPSDESSCQRSLSYESRSLAYAHRTGSSSKPQSTGKFEARSALLSCPALTAFWSTEHAPGVPSPANRQQTGNRNSFPSNCQWKMRTRWDMLPEMFFGKGRMESLRDHHDSFLYLRYPLIRLTSIQLEFKVRHKRLFTELPNHRKPL